MKTPKERTLKERRVNILLKKLEGLVPSCTITVRNISYITIVNIQYLNTVNIRIPKFPQGQVAQGCILARHFKNWFRFEYDFPSVFMILFQVSYNNHTAHLQNTNTIALL
jgi:hypothetical protein